jgi:hypothetical protein
MQKDSFELGNNKFLWMSIEQMENDKEIMKQNDDIVAFVKMKC